MKMILACALILLVSFLLGAAQPSEVAVLTVDGPINPATAAYLTANLQSAADRGDRLVLIEMDTPGGLDSSMRGIVKEIFAAKVPVAVYVAPSGARAASAGAVIALSAAICAMAPGTNIGAAHPVTMGQKVEKVMEEKILNDAEAYVEGIARNRGRNVELAKKMVRESISVSAERALQEKVTDLIATDRTDLLKKLEGRRIVKGGRETVLRLSGAKVVLHPMGNRDRILNTIGNPDVAYVLMLLGILGIFFELSTPGAIFPGVIGGISLILAFFAFQTLPVNYAGFLLILLAFVLFIAEIKIVSHGILAIGGAIAFILGSLLLFPSPEPYLRVSRWIIALTCLATALFVTLVITKAVQAHRQRPITGPEGLIGTAGVAETDVGAQGKVLIRGEYWNARSNEAIRSGEPVEVVGVEGLQVTVRKRNGTVP
ncbi:NfeD family protein [Geomesophilobacter sediminis]|uniref:Nodulation protein NfeD n=1 Tax=Geomesophilobacter sediminis TaxID=2798584 RepID=A0A8J7LWV4_9BACT|nr:nodulation protein NfeD [Geomesophilobacter sediminis]MBJ6726295.1 nodulation protein NfeD [Geomesophilobacter sediminis]